MLKRTPMKPRTAGLARTGRLKPVSEKQKAARATVSRACPLADCCVACGTSQQLTRSHILTVKMHPNHAANPLNVLTLCWPGHSTWENKKQDFKHAWPHAWNAKLAAMRKLNRSYYAFFCQKHGGPAGSTPY